MFQNILIVSDNINLCIELKHILSQKLSSSQLLTYAVSPYSDKNDFSDKLSCEALQYDLKKEEDIDEIISKYDLVISIHCKQIFPENLVTKIKCINIHPGYNPINRGWYPQVFSIINNLPIGATIHEIDAKLDHGNIIDQDFVSQNYSDTSLSLYNKITKKEIELFEKNASNILNNTYSSHKPNKEGNLYLKKDFNNLCEIDLNKQTTYLEVINHLRALTHGDYKNAFFVDPETNEKIFVSISLERKTN